MQIPHLSLKNLKLTYAFGVKIIRIITTPGTLLIKSLNPESVPSHTIPAIWEIRMKHLFKKSNGELSKQINISAMK